jgi:hypothetical protein
MGCSLVIILYGHFLHIFELDRSGPTFDNYLHLWTIDIIDFLTLELFQLAQASNLIQIDLWGTISCFRRGCTPLFHQFKAGVDRLAASERVLLPSVETIFLFLYVLLLIKDYVEGPLLIGPYIGGLLHWTGVLMLVLLENVVRR